MFARIFSCFKGNKKTSPSGDLDLSVSTFMKEGAVMKLVLLGDTLSGKTSLLNRMQTNYFNSNLKPTVGVDFRKINISVRRHDVKVQAWDVSGKAHHKQIMNSYLANAATVIIAFDLTVKNALDELPAYLDDVNRCCPLARIIIAGAKCELINDRRVTRHEIDAFLDDNGIDKSHYLEVSAKDNCQVKELFCTAVASACRDDARHVAENKGNIIAYANRRNKLIASLDDYVKKIDGLQGGLTHGFRFFVTSQAKNRELNRNLAIAIRDALTYNDKTASELFSLVNPKRMIGSSQLRGVMSEVRLFLSQPKPRENSEGQYKI